MECIQREVEEISNSVSKHPVSCGCSECFIFSCRKLPRNPNSYRTFIDSFIANNKCPLQHPHDGTLCAEYLKGKRENITTALKSFLDNFGQEPSKTFPRNIGTIIKSSTSSAASFSKIKNSANSAVNVQNLKSLIP